MVETMVIISVDLEIVHLLNKEGIKLKRPKRGDYYFNFGKCGPMKAERKCYGDCCDCYWHDMHHYEKYLKKNNLKAEPDNTDTPLGCPVKGRGQVHGKVIRYFLKASWQEYRTEVTKERYMGVANTIGVSFYNKGKHVPRSFECGFVQGWVEKSK